MTIARRSVGRKKTIALIAIEVCQKESIEILARWGAAIVDIYYLRFPETRGLHPFDAQERVIRALERSPLWENILFRGHDSLFRPRLVKAFKIASASK